MFLCDWILLAIGLVFLVLGFIVLFNKESNFYSFYRLHVLLFVCGVTFCLSPFIFNLFFNRCEVCEKYISTDCCTECGTYFAGDSLCSCGEILVDGYSFCPSCGRDLDTSNDS